MTASQDRQPPPPAVTDAAAALDGELQLGVAGNGDLRWAAVDVAGPLEEARYRLDLSPVSAVALGRALAAATLLLRFTAKAAGRLLVEVLGDGPLGKIVAEADSEGHLRGRVGKPRLATPEGDDLAIGWAVGKGLLRVTREGERGRYTSQVELVSGEMGRDLVHYLEQSQQIHAAALLGVLPRPTGIAAAGGVLIEAFPGTRDETLRKLESNIAALDGVSAYLADGGIAALRDAVLDGFDREDLERHRLTYRCRCSRDSLLAQLQQLSTADVESIVDDAGECVAECAFCGTIYRYPSDELTTH
jgi:molecular chaperone Hsp33